MRPRKRHDAAITSLGRYWDELLHGRPADPGELDPTLAETVHLLHARDDVPGADAAFTARLLAQLEDQMNTTYPGNTRPSSPLRLSLTPSANGRIPIRLLWSPPPPDAADRRRLPVPTTHLISAALVVVTLVLTLVVAAVTIGPPRWGGEDEQLAGVPAGIAQATPSPSLVTDETLATITLPAGAVPSEIVAGLNHYSVAAGSEATWDWTCCRGPRLDYILEGTYTVRGTGPMQVQRAGQAGSWAEIEPGTEIVLDAGDALLSQLEDTFEGVNAGSTPVELLDVVLLAGAPIDDPVPYEASGAAAWQFNDQDIWLLPMSMPAEPVTLHLRETSIAATSELPVPPDALLQLAVSRDEGAVPSTQKDFAVMNYGPAPINVYVLTLAPATPATGTPAP